MSSSEEEDGLNHGEGGRPWDNDGDIDFCTSCGVTFNLLRWKHHCRRCGHIFCSECAPSDNRMPIPSLGYDEPVRHCLRCSMGDVRNLGTVRFDRDPVPLRLRAQSTEETEKDDNEAVSKEDVTLTSSRRHNNTTRQQAIFISDRVIFAKSAHGSGTLKSGSPQSPLLHSVRMGLENSPSPGVPKFKRVESTMFHRKVISRKAKAPDTFWRRKRLEASSSASSSSSSSSSSNIVQIVEKVLDDTIHTCRDPEYVRVLKVSDMLDRERKSFQLISNPKNNLMKIGRETLKLLQSEKYEHLVHLSAPVKVFGSLNGDSRMLLESFWRYGGPSHRVGDIGTIRYVFSGNFVGDDRISSLEILTLLLCLKLRYHPRIQLLRGRNETKSSYLNILHKDTMKRLGKDLGTNFFETCLKPIFKLLPVACVVEEKILVITGKLLKKTSCSSLLSSGHEVLSFDNDDDDDDDDELDLEAFCDENDLDMIIETSSSSSSSFSSKKEEKECVCVDKTARLVSIRYCDTKTCRSAGFAEITGDLGVQLKTYSYNQDE